MSDTGSRNPPPRRRRLLPWLILLLLTVLGLLLLWALRPEPAAVPPPDPRPLVTVAEYQRDDGAVEVSRLGRVHARHESRLAAEISGRVVDVHADLQRGGRIEAGEILVRLDPRPLAIRRAELLADLRAREAERDALALQLERVRDLVRREFAAVDTFDELSARTSAARAMVQRVEAMLEAVDLDLARSELRAPFTATVLAASVAPGDIVQPGMELARLASATRQEIRVSLTLAELPVIESALERNALEAALPETPAVPLRPDRLAASIDDDTRTVLLALAADDLGLRRGDLVRVLLRPTPAGPHYRLPRAALRQHSERAGAAGTDVVWRVDAEGRLQPARVTPIIYSGDHVHVSSAELGDAGQVLVTALPTVTPGMAVRLAGSAAEGGGL